MEKCKTNGQIKFVVIKFYFCFFFFFFLLVSTTSGLWVASCLVAACSKKAENTIMNGVESLKEEFNYKYSKVVIFLASLSVKLAILQQLTASVRVKECACVRIYVCMKDCVSNERADLSVFIKVCIGTFPE